MVRHFTAESKYNKVYLFASYTWENCCKQKEECLSKKEKVKVKEKVKEKGAHSVVSRRGTR